MGMELIESLSRERLLKLIEVYAKSWQALDGVWFQSIEQKFGMEEAMRHDANAWRRYTELEAKRIKAFLGLEELGGLEGLRQALSLRFYAGLNKDEIHIEGNKLVYRMLECRVQTARTRKGMPLHPCKPVGEIEYAGFAKVIDRRITCRALSCYPDVTDPGCHCAWEFTLQEA